MLGIPQQQAGRVRDRLISAAEISARHRKFFLAQPASCIRSANPAKEGRATVSPPYAGGVTGTVTHDIAATLTAGQITAAQDMPGVWVARDGRWVPGDGAVVTSGDGRVFADEAERMDVCTGEVTITLPGI